MYIAVLPFPVVTMSFVESEIHVNETDMFTTICLQLDAVDELLRPVVFYVSTADGTAIGKWAAPRLCGWQLALCCNVCVLCVEWGGSLLNGMGWTF